MDVLGWIWWLLSTLLGLVWSIGWFLLGGWVVTLAQIGVIVGGIFVYKYGWQRAPIEIASRARTVGGFLWSWMRAREGMAAATASPRTVTREVVRTVKVKEHGDVNLSTLMSVAAIIGLGLIAVT